MMCGKIWSRCNFFLSPFVLWVNDEQEDIKRCVNKRTKHTAAFGGRPR